MGKPIILPGQSFRVGLDEEQQDCVEKLKEALAEAERGQVSAVAIVVCMPNGYAHLVGGRNAGQLNLGLDSCKRAILDNLEKPVVRL